VFILWTWWPLLLYCFRVVEILIFDHFVRCFFIGVCCFRLVLSVLDGNDSLHVFGTELAWLLVAGEIYYSCCVSSLSRASPIVAVSRGSLAAAGSVMNVYVDTVILHAQGLYAT